MILFFLSIHSLVALVLGHNVEDANRLAHGIQLEHKGRLLVNPKPVTIFMEYNLKGLIDSTDNLLGEQNKFHYTLKQRDDFSLSRPPKEKHEQSRFLDYWNYDKHNLQYNRVRADELSLNSYFFKTHLLNGSLTDRQHLLEAKQCLALALPSLHTQRSGKSTILHEREQRFIIPLVSTIIPILTMGVKEIASAVASDVKEVVKKTAGKKVVQALTKSKKTFIAGPKLDVLDTPSAPRVDHIRESYVRDFAYKNRLEPALAQTVLANQLDSNLLATAESIEAGTAQKVDEIDRFIANVADIREGKVTPRLVPLDTMKTALARTRVTLRKNGLPDLRLPISDSEMSLIYKYATPIVVYTEDTMILGIIMPFFTSSQFMTLHHIHSLPFLTTENIPMRLAEPTKFIAISNSSSHTYSKFTGEELEECRRIGQTTVCDQARPLRQITETSCETSIYNANPRQMMQRCTFVKSAGTDLVFSNIEPNFYGYFIPPQLAPVLLTVRCPRIKGTNVLTFDLKGSGTFQYAQGCTARAKDYAFYDTKRAIIKITAANASQQLHFSDFIGNATFKMAGYNSDVLSELLAIAKATPEEVSIHDLVSDAVLTLNTRATNSLTNMVMTLQKHSGAIATLLVASVSVMATALSCTCSYLCSRKPIPRRRLKRHPRLILSVSDREHDAAQTMELNPLADQEILPGQAMPAQPEQDRPGNARQACIYPVVHRT